MSALNVGGAYDLQGCDVGLAPGFLPASCLRTRERAVFVSFSSGALRFKFINGNTWDQAEVLPPHCSETAAALMFRHLRHVY